MGIFLSPRAVYKAPLSLFLRQPDFRDDACSAGPLSPRTCREDLTVSCRDDGFGDHPTSVPSGGEFARDLAVSLRPETYGSSVGIGVGGPTWCDDMLRIFYHLGLETWNSL